MDCIRVAQDGDEWRCLLVVMSVRITMLQNFSVADRQPASEGFRSWNQLPNQEYRHKGRIYE
jgi:hypothetical protein